MLIIYSKPVDEVSIESKQLSITQFPSMESVVETLLLYGFEILQDSMEPIDPNNLGCAFVEVCHGYNEINLQESMYILFKGRSVGTIDLEPL